MGNSENQPNSALPPRFHRRWPSTSAFPSDVDLRLVFHGLLSLCYTPQGYCEVGIYTASPKTHQLTVEIIQGECPTGTVIAHHLGSELKPDGTFSLEILNGTTGVTSYQTAGFDLRDFKLVPDIEGAHFFDVDETAQVPKRPGFYTQKLLVKKGVFYTLDTTFSTFIRNDHGTPLVLGNIAYYVGANIKFGSSDESALLRLPRSTGEPIEHEFHQSDGLREIHIINSCIPESGACDQIDFNLHFQSLRDLDDRNRFALATARRIDIRHSCDQVDMLLTSQRRSSDPAPCAATGYGSSGGTGG